MNMLLYESLAFTIHGKIYKSSTKIINLRSNMEWRDWIPGGRSYFISDIQNYFEYIIKQHETVISNPSIMIYVNKIETRITFKIKTENYPEILMPKTMKLLGSTKSKIRKDKNSKNVPNLRINVVVLIHFNIINNDYQQDLRVLYACVPNKAFGQSLDISLKSFIFFKTFHSEFWYIDIWFTDDAKPLEIGEINITLVIN